jgi:hypothetical protein
MALLRYICQSFISRRSCIEASDAARTRRPGERSPGLFFVILWLSSDVVAKSTIPDAVNLNSLWN